MNPAHRAVGRSIAFIAVELDSLATEVAERDLADADWAFLAMGYRHLRLAVEDLGEALADKCAQRDREHAQEVHELRCYDALRSAA